MDDIIREYLKQHLTIKLSENTYSFAPSDLCVTLFLGEEEITSDYIDLAPMEAVGNEQN